ncbi:MAG TPA: hypothetical protein VEV16_01035, partial [Daejeonella sp.]|nr:hypothetical protein [Daejeonella sp.]
SAKISEISGLHFRPQITQMSAEKGADCLLSKANSQAKIAVNRLSFRDFLHAQKIHRKIRWKISENQ